MRKEIRFITSNDIGMYVRYDEIDGEEFLSIECKINYDKYLLFTMNTCCEFNYDCDLFISSDSHITAADINNMKCGEAKVISLKEEYKGENEEEIEEMRLVMLDLILKYLDLDEDFVLDLWIGEGIESVYRVVQANKWRLCIELAPNYSFSGSGTQTEYCDSCADLKELINSIIYCDGTTIRKLKSE